ncbi:prohibitin-3 [Carex littledalei]|uniref:Prohibitin n=1 Tax=Carex littledalei TaxID=544730 RepID=A0A833QIZ7_9POAL|nr:prohibitin-3 [Carex littledalei]
MNLGDLGFIFISPNIHFGAFLNFHFPPQNSDSLLITPIEIAAVDGGQRAVIFDRFRGVLPETVGEGTHFLIPWLQKPYIFDIRTRPHTFTSMSGTKDLQMVNLSLRLLSRPDVLNLPTIFTSLGTEYDEKVLPSIGNEVLKAVVAQFNADQLLTESYIVAGGRVLTVGGLFIDNSKDLPPSTSMTVAEAMRGTRLVFL